MPKVKTYIDSCVLIAAIHGDEPSSEKALEILQDAERVFIGGDVLRLETTAPNFRNKFFDAADSYEEFIRDQCEPIEVSGEVTAKAVEFVKEVPIGVVDALHLASAIAAGAHEFVTSEVPTKPYFQINVAPMTVRSIA